MKKILTIAVLTAFNLMLFGQFYPLENYPTPNAASLGEFGKIPVNMYSGAPVISIPLYEVREGNISVPISLNYNLASVKPNVHPGWVGLGWSLSAGGAITRTVRGLPDEYENEVNLEGKGFFYPHARAALRNVNDRTGLSTYGKNFLTTSHFQGTNFSVVNAFELMTDEYNFNFGQYSGNFYLCAYRGWVVVSDHDIKVEFVPELGAGFRCIIASYPNNVFNNSNLREEIITRTWEYTTNDTRPRRVFDVFTLITPDGKRYTFGGKYATEYSINYYSRNQSLLIPTTWFLTKIESPEGYEVTFDYDPGKPICEIQLSAYYHFVTAGNLQPTGIYSTNNYERLVGYLMFPVYLKQIKATHTIVDFHTSVATDTLPYHDFVSWNINSEELGKRMYRFRSAEKYMISLLDQFKAFTDNSQYPSQSSKEYRLKQNLEWRVLDSITVNSNFSRKFILDYCNTTVPTDSGAISRRKLTRIDEQAEVGGDIIAHRFYYNTTPFSRYIFANIDHWGYYQGGERPPVVIDQAPHFNNSYYNSRNATDDMDIAQAETLSEIVYPTGGRTVFTYKQNTWSKIVPADRTQDLIAEPGKGGGLRVSEIKHYDAIGRQLQAKKYLYTDNINSYPSSGILADKKTYEIAFKVGYEYVSSGNISVLFGSEGSFMISGTNRMDPIVGYSSVIEQTMDENGNPIGYVHYRYTNHDSHRDENHHYAYDDRSIVPNLPPYLTPVSSISMERGKIVSEEYFDANDNRIKTIEYKYTRVNPDSIKAPWQERLPICCHNTSYVAFMNYIYTHRYFVSEIIETDFDPNTGKELTTTKRFAYNDSRLLTSEEITNSDGKTHRTRYIYPFEILSGPQSAILREMTNKHIISDYVHKISFVDDMVVGVETRIFGNVGTVAAPIYKPVEIRVLQLNNPIPENQLYTTQGVSEKLSFHSDLYPQTNSASQEFTLGYSGQLHINSIDFNEKHIGDFHMSSCYYRLQVITNGWEIFGKEIFMIMDGVGNGPGTMYRFEDNNISIDLPPGIYTIILTRIAPPFFENEPPNYMAEVNFVATARTTDVDITHRAFRPEISYKYDNKGNVVEVRLIQSNTVTAYLWSYTQQYPIAQIEGIDYAQVRSVLTDDFINNVAKAEQPSDNDMQTIRNEIQASHPDALVTTYTHKPLVGISSITDPRGITTYYNYDAFGRLREVHLMENGQKQILQAYDYQYRTID